jgi:hypothetical protein
MANDAATNTGLQPQRAVADLKELRQLTGNADGSAPNGGWLDGCLNTKEEHLELAVRR